MDLLAKSSKQAIPILFQMVAHTFKALNAEKLKYLSVTMGCIIKYMDSYSTSYYKSQKKCFKSLKIKNKIVKECKKGCLHCSVHSIFQYKKDAARSVLNILSVY